jgi:hypothetical protein
MNQEISIDDLFVPVPAEEARLTAGWMVCAAPHTAGIVSALDRVDAAGRYANYEDAVAVIHRNLSRSTRPMAYWIEWRED